MGWNSSLVRALVTSYQAAAEGTGDTVVSLRWPKEPKSVAGHGGRTCQLVRAKTCVVHSGLRGFVSPRPCANEHVHAGLPWRSVDSASAPRMPRRSCACTAAATRPPAHSGRYRTRLRPHSPQHLQPWTLWRPRRLRLPRLTLQPCCATPVGRLRADRRHCSLCRSGFEVRRGPTTEMAGAPTASRSSPIAMAKHVHIEPQESAYRSKRVSQPIRQLAACA